MSRSVVLQSPAPEKLTSCGSLLKELQGLWDEIGEDDNERDKMILLLEQECLNVYRRKVDQTRKYKADLHQTLAKGEAEISNLISTLGEREHFAQFDKQKGTLKQQVDTIKPTLAELRMKKEERLKDFKDVQHQIFRICAEVAGKTYEGGSASSLVDERDLTLKRLGELKSHLQELQNDKNLRLQKVNMHLKSIHELSTLMSLDFHKMISEVHPSFGDSTHSQPKSISNDTLAGLAGVVHSLSQEKRQRLRKLQDLGSTLMELWNLLDSSLDEQKRFCHVTCLIPTADDEVNGQGCLALDVIEQAELEVTRLNILKASKMKELLLKKQTELEDIYRSVHMDVDTAEARQMLGDLIDSGKVDLSELLSGMDSEIAKAKDHAFSRKDILDKVEKWRFACEEESWLEDYERDQNRYNAGRGAHKNLKRAEKARALISKIPSLVEILTSKIRAWEEEKGTLFFYDKIRLLISLEDYCTVRQQKEEEKRRFWEQKKLQDQFAAEQHAMFGSKPSPMRQLSAKKPLGHSSSANTILGTPAARRVSTPIGRHGISSIGKDRKEGSAAIPANYVALAKNDSLPQGTPGALSP